MTLPDLTPDPGMIVMRVPAAATRVRSIDVPGSTFGRRPLVRIREHRTDDVIGCRYRIAHPVKGPVEGHLHGARTLDQPRAPVGIDPAVLEASR